MATKPFERSGDIETQARDVGEATFGPAFMAAAASVALSWYLYATDNRHMALFVGLWPPTILSFASYVRERRIMNSVEQLTSPGESVRDAIESVIG